MRLRIIKFIAAAVVGANVWVALEIIRDKDSPDRHNVLSSITLLNDMSDDLAKKSLKHIEICRPSHVNKSKPYIIKAINMMDSLIMVQDSALIIISKISESATRPEEAEQHYSQLRKLVNRHRALLEFKRIETEIAYLGKSFTHNGHLIEPRFLVDHEKLITAKAAALRYLFVTHINSSLKHLACQPINHFSTINLPSSIFPFSTV